MAEREEKLAAARKRLKKFQSKKTPSSSPVVLGKFGSKNKPVDDELSTSFECNDVVNQPSKDFLDNKLQDKTVPVDQENAKSPNQESIPFSNGSPAEKIRQMCNQLNGLNSQDLMINGEVPSINEIESLESRNRELEEGLQSYKRSNEQLNNQVNEQERSELANRQLLEQRTLKEQLEVHIQTIGILVGEKQELQGSVTQLQRTLVTKESENSELSGRLQAVRQKITELEKNNASLSADLDKYKDDFNHVRQERDRYQTANYTHGKNNEDLLQQVEELKVKLDTKVSENGELTKINDEISFKLKQAELIVQQLSTEPSAAATQSLVEKLQDERQDLENRLDQVTRSLKNYQLDNEELQQRQTDEAGEFENKLRSLKEQVISLERQKQEWESKELQLQENMQSLSIQLGEIQDEEALEKQEATSRVAAQISKLTEEKQQLVEHLQKEALQNDKLKKMEAKYVHQIHELELNLGRLEEDARDRASLLETVQSDKETISRALKQNKELKDQLGQMEERFVKMTNDNMELTNQRDNEKHVARELAIKLSETAVELEETKEKLDGSSSEVDSLRTQNELAIKRLQDQLSQKDFELSSLREEVTTSSQRLEATQAQTVEYYKQYEEQTQKMQAIYKQLHTSEEAISQLTSENTHLRTILDGHNDIASERSDSSLDDISGQPINGKTSIEEDDFSDTESTKERVYHNNELNKSDMKMVPQGTYINGDMYDGTREDTDSSEEMDMAPRTSPPHQISKYTSREDVVEGLSVSIRQLEMEREQLTHLIQSQQDSHKHELQRVQEHMQLQLQQQLQQQYRYVQEQFHQTLHEQQQKIMLLQEVLQKQKAQIEKNSEEEDISSFEEDNISHETLKNAFSKLQVRFKNLMDEKVSLQERVQDLEHLTDQLSFETETIEEYVTLYQTQRASLKNYYNEREKIITQLSNEKGDMQNKISQLQSLVRQLIEERQGLQQQQQQMQNIVNKRMLAHEHENVIPLDNVQSLDVEDSLLKSEEDSSFNLDNSLDSGRESPDFEYRPNEDGTTRQILQLLEQLGPSEEGGVSGWLSPEVRNRDFLPCRYCAESRLIQI